MATGPVEVGVWSSGDLTATATRFGVGTQYDVQMSAVNASGAGPWSALIGVTLEIWSARTAAGKAPLILNDVSSAADRERKQELIEDAVVDQ